MGALKVFRFFFFMLSFILTLLITSTGNFGQAEEGNLFCGQKKDPDGIISSVCIQTENKALLKGLTGYFKNKPVSKKEIQKFLVENSYFQSEVKSAPSAYIITNPVQIVFHIKGHSFFTEKEIRKLIKTDEHKAGPRFYDFIEAAIKRVYKRQGFLNIQIIKKEKQQKGKKWIFINISEGQRMRIAKLQVRGLLSGTNRKYENFIKNNSGDLIKKGFYSKKDLQAGYKSLIHHLKSQGYLQSKIYSDRVSFKKDKVFITIHLEEGPLTLIDRIDIQNSQSLPVWEILSSMRSRIQAPLQVNLLWEDIENIEKLYKSKGYLNMKVTNKEDIVQYTPGKQYASIVINIEEGPIAFISKIVVRGLNKTKEKLVRKLLKFKEGVVLTPLKRKKSIKSLGATGLWTDVSINEIWKKDGLTLEILLTERKRHSIRGGMGLNTERGWTTRAYSEFTHRNLFGWGRSLTARASGKVNLLQKRVFLGYEVLGRYREVFVPGGGYQGDISISQSKNAFNYSKDNINFVTKSQISFFINKKISSDLKMRWNIWSFENRKEACVVGACPENPQTIGDVGFKVIYDKRDNIFDPSEGHLNSLSTQWATPFLGSSSNISFIKLDWHNLFYWTFAGQYTLGCAVKGGLIRAVQGKRYLPVSRAFILGGQNSLRGYDGNIDGDRVPRERITPIESANSALKMAAKSGKKEHVLNSYYGLLNMNFRFPLFKDFKAILFYDFGLVFLESQKDQIFDYGHSAGLGFRYQTFLIPIGLDIAYKLPPREGSHYRLHFSIGW